MVTIDRLLGAAHLERLAYSALVVLVLPLEAVVDGLAELLAVVGGFGRGAFNLGEFVPLEAVQFFFLVGGVLFFGEVGPVFAEGEHGVFYEVVEDVHPEDW